MNIKELKDKIEYFPDDMEVCSLLEMGGNNYKAPLRISINKGESEIFVVISNGYIEDFSITSPRIKEEILQIEWDKKS